MTYAEWDWQFLGLQWLNKNQPVQEWFDGLPDEAQAELRDTIRHLQHLPPHLWKKPQFDHLAGEDVTEVRFETATHFYRIYGYFGPKGERQSFTFLLGNDKKIRNDIKGKREATKRRGFVERGEATVHGFGFYRRTDRKTQEGS
jgi:hypothetical protein